MSRSRQGPGELATSIIAPWYRVGVELTGAQEVSLSPMGDYSEALTVADMAALLDHLGARNAAFLKTGMMAGPHRRDRSGSAVNPHRVTRLLRRNKTWNR